MPQTNRRTVLGALAVTAATPWALRGAAGASDAIPMLHCTDLFRPHMDPDDHWDLACVYALAYTGAVALRAVVTDYPPDKCDPDVMAVAQMNHITHMAVPVAVGLPRADQAPGGESAADNPGVALILDTLRQSRRPVVINVIGSCRTLAAAAQAEPRLFGRKCRAVYLNAGTGSPDPTEAAKHEYNVSLDPASYAAMFALPCPLYWMPCFERMGKPPQVAEFGTFYSFRQGDILPHLSGRVQNYFAYMLGRAEDSNWYRYLHGPRDEALLADQSARDRHMWCTGGFLHAAGKAVAHDGEIIALRAGDGRAVLTFEPIRITCDGDGTTRWTLAERPGRRYIVRVRDVAGYGPAMTLAMKTLLMRLP